MNRIKQPLPDNVLVSSSALAQIISALNGPQYMILELTVTRGLGKLAGEENPIDLIERELLAHQSGEVANLSECPYAIDDDFTNCAMRNYVRIPEVGAPVAVAQPLTDEQIIREFYIHTVMDDEPLFTFDRKSALELARALLEGKGE